MMYNTLLARSFSKHEQIRLGYGAMAACFFIALSTCIIFKPYFSPLPVSSLPLSRPVVQESKIINGTGSPLLIETEITKRNAVAVTGTSDSVVRDQISVGNKLIARKTGMPFQTERVFEDAENTDKNPLPSTNTSNSSRIVKEADVTLKHTVEPICNSTERSDFCDVKGDIRIDPNSSTVFIVSSETNILASENTTWNIRAYARKDDHTAMSMVKGWSVKLVHNSSQGVPQCTRSHDVPAVLFSAGAYSGNHFHAFTDIIVPLYSTARSFNGEVRFLISNLPSWWMQKFEILMRALSKYEVMDMDKRQGIDCFPGVVVGLKRLTKKELHVDPSVSGYSMKDFREFLRSAYSLKKATAVKIKDAQKKKRPRLLIISRKKSRAFTNVGDIARMAKKLGFNVVVAEADANLSGFAKIMNSCDVVMGVHGAGLTNILFLPENAILIQVVPFGGAEWVSKYFFEEPSKQMNIRYLEYKIKVEESSLIQQYPTDHVVLRNPRVIQEQGWLAFKSIYMDQQNVKLDLNRFRTTLLKALKLLHES